jgi:hypothetical protein
MASIKNVFGRIQYDLPRLDGGLNSKVSPSKIAPEESPDCLNVDFEVDGSVRTRDGTAIFNTTTVGTATVDGAISYNSQMIIWANGRLWRNSSVSGTTFTVVTSSSGHYQTGTAVAAVVHQNVLFSSDGVNGPWKYTGSENFYNMGIDKPSAPTGASTGAGSIATGTYYYAVSFLNSQVVEGEIGSVSAGIAVTTSATIQVSQIPIGSALAGTNARLIYRSDAASGPFRKVGQINDNVTTTFSDTVTNGGEGKFNILDASKPKAFNTITLHQERLFFDDFDDSTFVRYTDFQNPYVSEALNLEPMNQGDGFPIQAVSSQDNFLSVFKKNKIFTFETVDPSDDLTWIKRELPGNIGIVGRRAFAKVTNGTAFMGLQNGRISGVHLLQGIRLVETSDGRLRSLLISDKVEPEILNNTVSTLWDKICMNVFENKLFVAYARTGASQNNRILWLDLARVGTEGQPGSWAPWDGINCAIIFQHDGILYWGDSTSTGFVRKFNAGTYSDSGSAINSYFLTKQIGGEENGSLDSYVKNLREIFVWYAKLGGYTMGMSVRMDGDSGNGISYNVDLSQSASLWGGSTWGGTVWTATRVDFESRVIIEGLQGKRFQVKFHNNNTVGQGFKVHRLELGMILRRKRV